MLKKDLYQNLYIVTSLVLIGILTYYVFILQRDIVETINQDPKYIKIASEQSGMGHQMVKAAIGMGYSDSKKGYSFFQNELKRVYPKWQQRHQALLNGDISLGLSQPDQSDEYLELHEKLRFLHFDMKNSATSLIKTGYIGNRGTLDYRAFRKLIQDFINVVGKYDKASNNIADYFLSKSQKKNTSLSLAEIIGFSVFIGLFLIQGFFIFRPLNKLAGENFLSANKAFVKVQKSEQQLKVAFEKQKLVNKKLFVSQKAIEKKNKELQDSESLLKQSADEQLKVNKRLISAQDELNEAYKRLQDSETEIRDLADKQLQDNEKLFLAEKKMQKLLEKEQESKEELSVAIQRLKGTQSQLVHSEKMASLGQLTAGIAHEINNPINFISSGMVSLKMSLDSLIEIVEEYERIDDGEDPQEVVETVKELKEEHEYDEIMDELEDLVGDINYGVTRTVEIVKGLRVFSRLDEEESKKANVNENIDATLTLLRNKTKGKIEITKDYDSKMGDIQCYPGQLNQVFMNILNNAVQAMPEDKRDAEIIIETEERTDDVVIKIQDNGTGIPDEIKERIWEPFFTTKEVGVGTGLGMSISYGIIQKHGGEIELDSTVGVGTTFTITLPKVIKVVKKEEA